MTRLFHVVCCLYLFIVGIENTLSAENDLNHFQKDELKLNLAEAAVQDISYHHGSVLLPENESMHDELFTNAENTINGSYRDRSNGLYPDQPLIQLVSQTYADLPPYRGPETIELWQLRIETLHSPLVLGIFLILVCLIKMVFHGTKVLSNFVPEPCVMIVFGTMVGFVLDVFQIRSTGEITEFLFFFILLPPLVLESGFSLHDRVFFEHIGIILLYSVLGTLLSFFLIGSGIYVCVRAGLVGSLEVTWVECHLFSSILVSVEPLAVLVVFEEIGVNPLLYFMVFGESLFNDAICVVLYNTMQSVDYREKINDSLDMNAKNFSYVMASFITVTFGGLLVGLVLGVVMSWMTKHTKNIRVVEPLAIFAFSYTSYITAELFGFSGIMSIIATGFIITHYAFPNISERSHTTVLYFTKMLSTTAESIVYMYLGISIIHLREYRFYEEIGFAVCSYLVCIVSRFIAIFMVGYVANYLTSVKEDKAGLEELFIMAYGALRGAVSYALVITLDGNYHDKKELYEHTTIIIIMAMSFLQGSTVKPLTKLFRIASDDEDEGLIIKELFLTTFEHVIHGIKTIVGDANNDQVRWREQLENFDKKYMMKWLLADQTTDDEKMEDVYRKVAEDFNVDGFEFETKEGHALRNFMHKMSDSNRSLSDEENIEKPRKGKKRVGPQIRRDKAPASSTAVGPEGNQLEAQKGAKKRFGGILNMGKKEKPQKEDDIHLFKKMIAPKPKQEHMHYNKFLNNTEAEISPEKRLWQQIREMTFRALEVQMMQRDENKSENGDSDHSGNKRDGTISKMSNRQADLQRNVTGMRLSTLGIVRNWSRQANQSKSADATTAPSMVIDEPNPKKGTDAIDDKGNKKSRKKEAKNGKSTPKEETATNGKAKKKPKPKSQNNSNLRNLFTGTLNGAQEQTLGKRETESDVSDDDDDDEDEVSYSTHSSHGSHKRVTKFTPVIRMVDERK